MGQRAKSDKPTVEKNPVKRTAGRPRFVPTLEERKQVEVFAGFGLPIEHIGTLVRGGIHKETVMKAFPDELVRGKAKANVKVAQTLFNKATSGDVTAMIWWTKSQMGWREVQKHEVTGADGGPVLFTKIERVIVHGKDAAQGRNAIDQDT